MGDMSLSPAFADRRYRALEAERAELLGVIETKSQRYAYLGDL